MTTEPFIPHADSIQTAWVLMCQQSRIATQPSVEELEAEFDRFIARVRAEAVEDYKRTQVKIHISPPAPAPSLVAVRPCPRCGF